MLPTRDFCDILDTVAGLLAICEIINFGTGREISIGNLAQEIADVLGPPLKLQEDVQRLRPASSEVDRPLAANLKAKKLIAWEPQWSLRDGLSATAKWIEAHLNDYKAGRYTARPQIASFVVILVLCSLYPIAFKKPLRKEKKLPLF